MAHYNMVEQQIRPWNVHSPRLLEAITGLDRLPFVPAGKQALCCVDTQIALPNDVVMLEPKVAARLVQALDIQPEDRVLLVGVGSGYTAALCSKLAHSVECLDPNLAALEQAKNNIEALSLSNISFNSSGESDKLPKDKEYDAILIRESRSTPPDAYFPYLSPAGRCVALVGKGYVMEMMRYTRNGNVMEFESITDILKTSSGQSATTSEDFVF